MELVDLRSIIEIPGKKKEFSYSPDLDETAGDSVLYYIPPSLAVGEIVNKAGVLTLSATVEATQRCICAKCMSEFDVSLNEQITAYIVQAEDNLDDSELYFYDDDVVDVDLIIKTELIINRPVSLYCIEDCAGLCEKCGHDLNHGNCDCKDEVDERLIALQQLLDELEEE